MHTRSTAEDAWGNSRGSPMSSNRCLLATIVYVVASLLTLPCISCETWGVSSRSRALLSPRVRTVILYKNINSMNTSLTYRKNVTIDLGHEQGTTTDTPREPTTSKSQNMRLELDPRTNPPSQTASEAVSYKMLPCFGSQMIEVDKAERWMARKTKAVMGAGRHVCLSFELV